MGRSPCTVSEAECAFTPAERVISVERIDSTTAFLVYGTVNAQATSTGILGTLTGSFITADANKPSFWSRFAWCYSDGHAFEMRR
jgi:hypothetical protein